MLQNFRKNLFGPDPEATLSDAVKEQRRSIARSLRSLERQHAKAEGEERRIFAELKAQALAGLISVSHAAAAAAAVAAAAAAAVVVDKLQAKQLLVVRRRRAALLRCKAQLGAADIQPAAVQQQQATQELHRHFQGCAKLLSLVNKTVDLPSIQVAVKGFHQESQKLGLMDEILNEVLEDGTSPLEDEQETEDELLREIVACAETEIEQQLTTPVRHMPAQQQLDPLPQQQQQQQQQKQQQQLPNKQQHQQHQQRSSSQQQPQTALHASSSSRRYAAAAATAAAAADAAAATAAAAPAAAADVRHGLDLIPHIKRHQQKQHASSSEAAAAAAAAAAQQQQQQQQQQHG
ncbi:hypothetical protein Emag_006785 [Eimeria magna]